MYVMKDKNTIMTGHCNYRYGLWNILVQKTQTKIGSYIEPIPHPSMYPFRIPLAYEK